MTISQTITAQDLAPQAYCGAPATSSVPAASADAGVLSNISSVFKGFATRLSGMLPAKEGLRDAALSTPGYLLNAALKHQTTLAAITGRWLPVKTHLCALALQIVWDAVQDKFNESMPLEHRIETAQKELNESALKLAGTIWGKDATPGHAAQILYTAMLQMQQAASASAQAQMAQPHQFQQPQQLDPQQLQQLLLQQFQEAEQHPQQMSVSGGNELKAQNNSPVSFAEKNQAPERGQRPSPPPFPFSVVNPVGSL